MSLLNVLDNWNAVPFDINAFSVYFVVYVYIYTKYY